MESSILDKEIHEQPDVVAALIREENKNVQSIASSLKGKFKHILIAARGTSDNAARYAQYLFGVKNQMLVGLATPSTFSLYGRYPDLSDVLVIGISQSGQSPDIVSVLAEGKRQGCPTLAITNNVHSKMAETADSIIPLHAGEEKAIAATKTYTTSLAALALLSCSLADDHQGLEALDRIPDLIQETLLVSKPTIARTERYRYIEHCDVIGRGYNYSTTFEIALKVKELTRVVAEPYSSADFRHGPIATAQQGFPVILIAPSGVIFQDILELAEKLKSKGVELLVISDQKAALSLANFPLQIPSGIPEWLSPLVTVVPGQLFAMKLALEKGLDADRPEGLTKVTETK